MLPEMSGWWVFGTLVGLTLAIGVGVALAALWAFVFRWLWNTTVPEVFGLRRLSYWQAFKIILLAGLLFGGHLDDSVRRVAEHTVPPIPQPTGTGP